MEPLHGVLRAIRQLTPRRDDLSVFANSSITSTALPAQKSAQRQGEKGGPVRRIGLKRSAATRRSRKMGRRVMHQDQKSEQSRKRP